MVLSSDANKKINLPEINTIKENYLIVGTWAHAEIDSFEVEYLKVLRNIIDFCKNNKIKVSYKPHPNSGMKLEKKIFELMRFYGVGLEVNSMNEALEGKTHAIHFGSLAIKEILLKNVVPIYIVNSSLSWWIKYDPIDFIIENEIGHILKSEDINNILNCDNNNLIWLERLRDSYGI
jgi:hypothetical protein